jgi:hypothetical protein
LVPEEFAFQFENHTNVAQQTFSVQEKYGLRPNSPFNSAVHPLFRNLCSSGATVLRKQHYFVLGICKNAWAYLKY